MADEPREESWDRGLEQAFGGAGKSVLEALGARSRISLRDAPGDPSPLVRVPGRGEADAAKDDSRYQVLGEIGRGGIGTVYKAHDRDLGRDVALKVLRSDLAENDEVFQRFLEEAQIGGQLQHPGLVPVYGLGLQADGRPFFAMKLVKGETLSALLRARLGPGDDRRRFLTVFEQVCQTVAYAHSRGVVHRDLKPSNVMVGAFGEVQVVDWGFAKVLGLARERPQRPDVTRVATVRSEGASGSESQAGSVMGTPAYMPPEQALGHVEELDERSDVFALGAILCEILTGQPPYGGSGRDQLLAASQCRLDEGWKRLDACGADPELVALCRKCLSPLRRDRPRDAGGVAQAVEAHLHAVEERARQAEIFAAEGRAREIEERVRADRENVRAAWERKARRRMLGLASAVVLAAVLGGWLYVAADAREARRRVHTSDAVSRAMEEASRLGAAGDWPAARVAAESAAQFARLADATDRERAAHMLADVQTGADRAAAASALAAENTRLIDQLVEISLSDLDGGQVEAAYAEVFSSLGIDPDRLTVEEAARLIRERGSVAAEFAAALDGWAFLRANEGAITGESRDWRRLVRIAQASDTDPWRNDFREAVLERSTLPPLAEAEAAADLPGSTLALAALMLLWLGEPTEAEALLRRAAIRRPGDARICSTLALLPSTSRVEAVRFQTAALAARPRSIEARHALGLALRKAGDIDGAITVWKDVLKSRPGYGHVLAHIAEARIASDPRAAVRTAEEAVALQPGDVFARLMLGEALRSNGLPLEAIAVYREALELHSQEASLHNSIGSALQQMGQMPGAIAEFREAVRLRPHVSALRHNLGMALLAGGLEDECVRELREAIRLDPGFSDALQALARCLATCADLGRRNPEEALALARRAAENAPNDQGALRTLAIALYRNGLYAECVQAFERAREVGPDFAGFFLAMARWRLGQAEQARAQLRHAVEFAKAHAPGDPETTRFRAEAEELIGK